MADLLLVDNDERIVELLAWFLRRCGHDVRSAGSYREARRQIEGQAPDLMLADLELHEERGEEELPVLAREGLLPPTLVVSGYLDPAIESALTAVPGILGTLPKPFDLERLRTRIDSCLALHPPGGEVLRAARAGGVPVTGSGHGPVPAGPPGDPLSADTGSVDRGDRGDRTAGSSGAPEVRDPDRNAGGDPEGEDGGDDGGAGWVEIVPLDPRLDPPRG